MLPPSLEQRVAALEQEVSELKARPDNGRVKDWRRTVGRFTDDPGMTELFAEAMKVREADRRKVRRRPPKKRPTASRSSSTRTTSPCSRTAGRGSAGRDG